MTAPTSVLDAQCAQIIERRVGIALRPSRALPRLPRLRVGAQWRSLRSQSRMPGILPKTRAKPPGWTWKYENATSALAQMHLLNEPAR